MGDSSIEMSLDDFDTFMNTPLSDDDSSVEVRPRRQRESQRKPFQKAVLKPRNPGNAPKKTASAFGGGSTYDGGGRGTSAAYGGSMLGGAYGSTFGAGPSDSLAGKFDYDITGASAQAEAPRQRFNVDAVKTDDYSLQQSRNSPGATHIPGPSPLKKPVGSMLARQSTEDMLNMESPVPQKRGDVGHSVGLSSISSMSDLDTVSGSLPLTEDTLGDDSGDFKRKLQSGLGLAHKYDQGSSISDTAKSSDESRNPSSVETTPRDHPAADRPKPVGTLTQSLEKPAPLPPKPSISMDLTGNDSDDDKKKFFSSLERKSEGPVDYGELNRDELARSSTASSLYSSTGLAGGVGMGLGALDKVGSSIDSATFKSDDGVTSSNDSVPASAQMKPGTVTVPTTTMVTKSEEQKPQTPTATSGPFGLKTAATSEPVKEKTAVKESGIEKPKEDKPLEVDEDSGGFAAVNLQPYVDPMDAVDEYEEKLAKERAEKEKEDKEREAKEKKEKEEEERLAKLEAKTTGRTVGVKKVVEPAPTKGSKSSKAADSKSKVEDELEAPTLQPYRDPLEGVGDKPATQQVEPSTPPKNIISDPIPSNTPILGTGKPKGEDGGRVKQNNKQPQPHVVDMSFADAMAVASGDKSVVDVVRAAEAPKEPGHINCRLRESELLEKISTLEDEVKKQAEEIETLRSQHKNDHAPCLKNLKDEQEEKYVLQAKLEQMRKEGDVKERIVRGESVSALDAEAAKKLEREVREQETLIKGYQKENEKLVEELKVVKTRGKELEHEMFLTNQKLAKEMERLRESSLLQPDFRRSSSRINQPSDEVTRLKQEYSDLKRASEAREVELKFELDRLREAKKKIEAKFSGVDLDRIETDGVQVRELEEKLSKMTKQHEEEVDRLQSKLKWYAENQELINHNDDALAEQKAIIEALQSRVQSLEQHSNKAGPGDRNEQKKVGNKKVTTAQGRIRELEKQLKEMDEAVRRRNPNSITAMIRATKLSEEEEEVVAYLHKRVDSLEKELNDRNEDTAKRIRVLRQEKDKMRVRYEQRITELEKERDGVQAGNKAAARENAKRRTEEIRDHYIKKLKDTEDAMKDLKKEHEAYRKGEEKRLKNVETKLTKKIKRLESDLNKREIELRSLRIVTASFEKGRGRRPSTPGKSPGKNQSGKSAESEAESEGDENLPPAKSIEESMTEMMNEMQTEYQAKIKKLEAEVEKAYNSVGSLNEEHEKLMKDHQTMQMKYEREISSLVANFEKTQLALGGPKVAWRDSNDVLGQQIHTLKNAYVEAEEKKKKFESELDMCKSDLSVLQGENASLIEKVKGLQTSIETLANLPGHTHYKTLLGRIETMEKDRFRREDETRGKQIQNELQIAKLKEELAYAQEKAQEDIESVKRRSQAMIDDKNAQIMYFKKELDTMLSALERLQRQQVPRTA